MVIWEQLNDSFCEKNLLENFFYVTSDSWTRKPIIVLVTVLKQRYGKSLKKNLKKTIMTKSCLLKRI